MMLLCVCVWVLFSLRAWRHYSCGESEWQCWSFFVATLPLTLIIHLYDSKRQDSCRLFSTVFISPYNLSTSISSSLLLRAILSSLQQPYIDALNPRSCFTPPDNNLHWDNTPPPPLLLWPQEAFFIFTCRLSPTEILLKYSEIISVYLLIKWGFAYLFMDICEQGYTNIVSWGTALS